MDFDWDAWQLAEAKRSSARRNLRQSRLVLAQKEAERLALTIRALEPRVSRIILFGSVARQNPKHEHFDIDLALEGAPSLALLEPEVTADGFRIDLVQMEGLSGRMRENIEREGVVLYGT